MSTPSQIQGKRRLRVEGLSADASAGEISSYSLTGASRSGSGEIS